MALADLFDFGGILQAIKGFLGPFGKLFDAAKQIYDHLTGIISSAEKLRDSIVSEVDAWRNFKQDIRLKQRVIQLEAAIEKTRDLIEGIPEAWRSILDIIKQFREQVQGENPIEDADAAATDLESGGIKSLLEKFPRLAKGLEKILGVAAIIVQALEAIANTIDDLQKIVDEVARLRAEVEKLDTIFLSQSNKRKTLKLADGSSIRVRIGHLHSA